jgi:REP element-mobilizing transposase RayT
MSPVNGERDHVHLLVIYPPKVRLSELVNSLKGVSSRRLKVAGNLHLLERAKERGRAVVPKLFCWFGWRRPY